MRVEIRLAALACFLIVLPAHPSRLSAQESGQGESPGGSERDPSSEPLNDIKLLAQSAALPSLQGDEKFILRESWWNGSISPGKAKLIQVQLFRRNAYRFWLAVPDRDASLNLNIYDSEGEMVPSEALSYEGTNVVGVEIEPELTGLYYVRVSLKTTIDHPQDWAVIYAYR